MSFLREIEGMVPGKKCYEISLSDLRAHLEEILTRAKTFGEIFVVMRYRTPFYTISEDKCTYNPPMLEYSAKIQEYRDLAKIGITAPSVPGDILTAHLGQKNRR